MTNFKKKKKTKQVTTLHRRKTSLMLTSNKGDLLSLEEEVRAQRENYFRDIFRGLDP